MKTNRNIWKGVVEMALLAGVLFIAGLLMFGTVGPREAYSSNTASSTITVSVRCDMSMQAVVPHTHYIVTLGQVTSSSPSQKCSSELNVIGDIHTDGRIESRCFQDRDGIQVYHKTPAMKLTGMLCQPLAHAELQVTNISEEESENVTVQAPNTSLHAAVFLAREEARPLFGNGGTVRQTGIRDGEDYDHIQNGEVIFGGTSPQTGGTMTAVNISQRALDGDSSAAPKIAFAFSAH